MATVEEAAARLEALTIKVEELEAKETANTAAREAQNREGGLVATSTIASMHLISAPTAKPHRLDDSTVNVEGWLRAVRNFIELEEKSLKREMSEEAKIAVAFNVIDGKSRRGKFLQEASLLSRYLLVEPQPWKCYKSAMRRVRKVGVENSWHFRELTMRDKVDEDISNYLTSTCQMELVRTLGETHWERKLLLFQNTTCISDTES